MDTGNRQVLGLGPDGMLTLYANNELKAPATYPFGGFELWTGNVGGGTSALWRNGVQTAAGNAGASGVNGFTVGALNSSGAWGYDYGHNQIAEILYYTGSLTTAQRRSISDWLND